MNRETLRELEKSENLRVSAIVALAINADITFTDAEKRFNKKMGKSYAKITYTPDFLIYHLDGSQELIDVKGFSNQRGEMRKKLFDFFYPDIKLTWIARSLKYGQDGWIEYKELQKKRRENKKCQK